MLVGAEVALALMLLAAAGLLLRSFGRRVAEPRGFDASGVLVADLALPASHYADGASRRAFYDAVLAEVAALPGVASAGATNAPPLVWGPNGALVTEDRPSETAQAHYRVVSADYFRALSVPLAAGRTFTAADDSASPHVAVVNETLVHMRPVAWGAALGIAGGLALSRVLRGLVYGIGVTDPATFFVATALLMGVALVASWLPARRVARVDPVVALRGE